MASENQLPYSPRRPRPWVLALAQLTLLAILVSCFKPIIALAVVDAPSQSRDQANPVVQSIKNNLQYSQQQAIAPPESEPPYRSLFRR
jgi:hypothetical protein